jgi:acyl-homoserine-lactone acylase
VFTRTTVALVLALVAGATAIGCSSDEPAAAGQVVGEGDEYEATIRRTAGDVPHITGDTLADVSFGQGWASGEDRTCDLADQIVKINGERSLWMGRGEGDANLASDLAWRTIGIVPRARADWAGASPDVIELVTGFTKGWNAHLDHVGADAVTGWCAGADWLRPLQTWEVYAYARSIALQASSAALVPYIPSAQPPDAPADVEVDNEPPPEGEDATTSTTPTTAPTPSTTAGAGGATGAGEGDGDGTSTTSTTGTDGSNPGEGEGDGGTGEDPGTTQPDDDETGGRPGSDPGLWDPPGGGDDGPDMTWPETPGTTWDDGETGVGLPSDPAVARGGSGRSAPHPRQPQPPGESGGSGGPTTTAGPAFTWPAFPNPGAGPVPPPAPAPDADAGAGAAPRTSSAARAPEIPGEGGPTARGTVEAGHGLALADEMGSNGWAIGRDRSASGGGMLLANPHFPWEGELRFWEVHLTVPGELDVYGAQLSGLPGVGIGFTEEVAWTHTVSAGHRFTAYRLDLVPGEPTTYRYGEDVREMQRSDVTVDVLDEDGSIDQVTRTMWSTHHGPLIDFPGVGWTESTAISYRDANLDDDEILDQYLAMARAEDLDDLIEAHERVGGVPLFNTVATSRDGRAWYADTSATPNLSPEALERYRASLVTDPAVRLAADNGAVLLDGSEPVFEWVDTTGARDPGLIPPAGMPQIERDDYVFNANDSFWLPHAEATIDGDYSPLQGDQRTARSPRTRENATLLADTSADGPAGEDGDFTLDELADAALANRGYTSRALLDAVVDRCDGAPQVFVPALPGGSSGSDLPAAGIYVGAACAVLAGWDGRYEPDRAGPPLWREMVHQMGSDALTTGGPSGPLWGRPFDPADPVGTPAGLAPRPLAGRDPVLDALARAVQILDTSGIAVDATLGDLQFAQRGEERIPIHGGDGADGTTNVVGHGDRVTILDPQVAALEGQRRPVAAGSPLGRYGDRAGYLVDNGTSFLLAVELTDDGPQARSLLAYGNTEDRSASTYVSSTEAFADKEWKDVAFSASDVDAAAEDTVTVRG